MIDNAKLDAYPFHTDAFPLGGVQHQWEALTTGGRTLIEVGRGGRVLAGGVDRRNEALPAGLDNPWIAIDAAGREIGAYFDREAAMFALQSHLANEIARRKLEWAAWEARKPTLAETCRVAA